LDKAYDLRNKQVQLSNLGCPAFSLLYIVGALATLLIVIGELAPRSINNSTSRPGALEVKIGLLLYTTVYIIATFVAFVTFIHVRHLQDRTQQKVLYIVMWSILPLATRLLYSVLSYFGTSWIFQSELNYMIVRAFASFLMEVIIIGLFLAIEILERASGGSLIEKCERLDI
jgi:hypothetical protein